MKFVYKILIASAAILNAANQSPFPQGTESACVIMRLACGNGDQGTWTAIESMSDAASTSLSCVAQPTHIKKVGQDNPHATIVSDRRINFVSQKLDVLGRFFSTDSKTLNADPYAVMLFVAYEKPGHDRSQPRPHFNYSLTGDLKNTKSITDLAADFSPNSGNKPKSIHFVLRLATAGKIYNALKPEGFFPDQVSAMTHITLCTAHTNYPHLNTQTVQKLTQGLKDLDTLRKNKFQSPEGNLYAVSLESPVLMATVCDQQGQRTHHEVLKFKN